MSAEKLQLFVEQIEAVNRGMKSLSLDRSELFKAAKQNSLDVKALRRVIAERKKTAAERAEEAVRVQAYMDALEAARPVLADA